MTEERWRYTRCPVCGAEAERSDVSVVCWQPNCGWFGTLEQTAAYLKELNVNWWNSLEDFERLVMSEPKAELAVRRVINGLVAKGVDSDIIVEIAQAINESKAHPMLDGQFDGVVKTVAEQLRN